MEEQSIVERIKTIEDAYAEKGLVRADEIPFANPKNGKQEAVNAVMDAFQLVEAYNEGWEPDWDNSNEPKYELWWDMRSNKLKTSAVGSGFSLLAVDYGRSLTIVGSRLVFKKRELGRDAAERFIEVFKAFMVIPKAK